MNKARDFSSFSKNGCAMDRVKHANRLESFENNQKRSFFRYCTGKHGLGRKEKL